MMKEDPYQKTISNSKQESMLKAVDLLFEELEKQKKTVERPNIQLSKMLLKVFFWMVPLLAFCVVWYLIPQKLPYGIWIALGYVITIFFLNAKKIVVSLILIYQKYAPERIRASCVFEPSCSNYMLLAIDKYGLISGVHRGIKRLLRCHYPNSGIDYP